MIRVVSSFSVACNVFGLSSFKPQFYFVCHPIPSHPIPSHPITTHLAPGFPVPGNSDYKGYHQYIDDVLPPESPYLYGLHPNAEIGFLTATSDNLFKTVLEMQPRDSGGGEGSGGTREEKVSLGLQRGSRL